MKIFLCGKFFDLKVNRTKIKQIMVYSLPQENPSIGSLPEHCAVPSQILEKGTQLFGDGGCALLHFSWPIGQPKQIKSERCIRDLMAYTTPDYYCTK